MDPTTTVPRLPAALAVERHGAFVGRASELAVLAEAWRPLLHGATRAQLLLVAGEPGVGKTRLVAEAAAAAATAGCRVLYGRADEDVILPLQPWAEAMRDYVAELGPERFEAWVASADPALGALLPGVLAEPPVAPDVESGRFRLFDAVARELRTLAERAPVVVVVDDLQWADGASLLLLRHVLRSGVSPLLVIATMRDTEPADDALHDVLASLRTDSATQRLNVGGLDVDDIEQLTPDAAMASDVHRLTAGNSFFVREVLQHLADDSAGGALPSTVIDVVRRRLWRLDDVAVDLLTNAAAVGREFDLSVLAEVSGVDEERALDALEAAVGARLVHEVGRVVDRFSFDHALVQQALSAELGPSRRARLHGRVGEVLEARWDGSAEGLADLARHYGEATDPRLAPKAVEFARRAAGDAKARYAYDDAVRHLVRAVARLDDSPSQFTDADATRLAVLLELGDALEGAERATDAVATFTDALALARQLDDVRAAAIAVLGASKGGPTIGASDAARVAEFKAVIASLPGDERALLVRMHSALVRQLVFLQSAEDTVDIARRGVSIARELGDVALLSHALGALHQALLGPGDPRSRLAIADEILALAETSGEIDLRRWAHAYRVIDRMQLGDLAGARVDAEAARDLGAADRPPRHEWWGHALVASADIALGRLADAEAGCNRSLELGISSGDANVLATWSTQVFVLRWCEHRLPELAEAAAAGATDPASQTPVARMAAALVAAESGDPASAQAALDEWRGRLHELPDDVIRLGAIALAAVVAHRVVDAEVGAECVGLLEPHRDTCAVIATGTAFLGSMHAFIAFGLAASGRLNEAIAALEEAIVANEAMGAATWATFDRDELRTLTARRGETEDHQSAG